MWPAVGERLRVRPPRREVVVRPLADPADATERDDREGGRLLGVTMLLGMLTARTESVGEDVFLGVSDDEAMFVGADDCLSSSFFPSGTAGVASFVAASLVAFAVVLPSFSGSSFPGAFGGVTCVTILERYL